MQTFQPVIYPVRSVIFSWRSFVAKEPQLYPFYLPFVFWDQRKQAVAGADPRQRIVDEQTELIIDGFQGSANSFASSLFKPSQRRDVKLAHHMHSPAQIIQGVKLNIPILVTIREPVGTVLSLTSRWSYISVTQGLKSYIGFYRKLQPYTSHFVISPFEQTTQHLNLSIKQVNAKFNVNFDLVDTARINAETQDQTKKRSRNLARATIKEMKKKELELPRNAKLLAEAQAVYQNFS